MNPKTKRRLLMTFQKWVLNPIVKLVAGTIGPALLETTGRKSGKTRRTPVGVHRKGDTFWLCAEHGRHSAYVRNLEAEPNVRIKYRFRWHEGIARTLPDADPLDHTPGLNGAIVRFVGTDMLVVRIDLKV